MCDNRTWENVHERPAKSLKRFNPHQNVPSESSTSGPPMQDSLERFPKRRSERHGAPSENMPSQPQSRVHSRHSASPAAIRSSAQPPRTNTIQKSASLSIPAQASLLDTESTKGDCLSVSCFSTLCRVFDATPPHSKDYIYVTSLIELIRNLNDHQSTGTEDNTFLMQLLARLRLVASMKNQLFFNELLVSVTESMGMTRAILRNDTWTCDGIIKIIWRCAQNMHPSNSPHCINRPYDEQDLSSPQSSLPSQLPSTTPTLHHAAGPEDTAATENSDTESINRFTSTSSENDHLWDDIFLVFSTLDVGHRGTVRRSHISQLASSLLQETTQPEAQIFLRELLATTEDSTGSRVPHEVRLSRHSSQPTIRVDGGVASDRTDSIRYGSFSSLLLEAFQKTSTRVGEGQWDCTETLRLLASTAQSKFTLTRSPSLS